ncbi:MAG: hypothetical protein IT329_12800 [Caldilineaceae bacterium]|nr:hypothetical protein [Caldilineaceae bacterium]
MYALVLGLHNLLRWVVILAALYLLFRTYSGLFGRRAFTGQDAAAARWFTISLDVQVLVGLLLYFVLSPVTRAALANFGAAMSDSQMRFFAVEHSLMMIVAVILGHIGTAQVRKAADDRTKFVRSAIWYTIAILVILAAVPWAFSPLLPAF